AGRVASGTVKTGEAITVLPSLRHSRIKRIHVNEREVEETFAGQSAVLTLEDEIDISRGDMIVRSHNLPEVSGEFEAVVCWMDERNPLRTDTQYLLQHTTRTSKVFVDEILYRMDVNSLHRESAATLELNELGRVKLTSAQPIFFDPYDRNRETGGFVIIDPADFRTVGAGMIRYTTRETLRELRRERGQEADSPRATNVSWETGLVSRDERRKRNAHPAVCVWLTGLSGSGKSTIAKAVEQQLFADGRQVFRLDGDNVRHGLCADLGFTQADRSTNIRRVGHAARLLFDAGQVVICSFIAPYAADRDFVRGLFPDDAFLEVYVRCDIEECKRRDPKGLYGKAERGEITGFTGVDDPYEEPTAADLVIDTTQLSEQQAVARVLAQVKALL
ncbi:MAG: adenylyl-sulfate kinase, partial [Spirochaetaceae bacterium]